MAKQTVFMDIVATYRSWHDLVLESQGFLPSKMVLIDDLCEAETDSLDFQSEKEVSDKFVSLISDIGSLKNTISDTDYIYTLSKLTQSLAFIKSKINPEKNSKQSVIDRGLLWEPVSDSDLETLSKNLKLAAEKYLANSSRHDSREDLEATLETDKDVIVSNVQTAVNIFEKNIYTPDGDGKTNVEFINSESTWRMMVTTSNKNIKLILNTGKLASQSAMSNSILPIHEYVGHVVHFERLKAQTDIQKNLPHLACICIHTQDAYYVEGIAQLITKFLIKNFYDEHQIAHVALAHFELEQAVRQRNVMDLIENKVSPKEAAKRHCEYFKTQLDDMIKMYEYLQSDTFFSCQVLAYHTSRVSLDHFMKMPVNVFREKFDTLSSNFFIPKPTDYGLQQ